MKRDKFLKSVHYFPAERVGTFDKAHTELTISMLLDTARNLNNPTHLAIAAELGIDRERVARLIAAHGIGPEYQSIRTAAKERRADEKVAAMRAASAHNDKESATDAQTPSRSA